MTATLPDPDALRREAAAASRGLNIIRAADVAPESVDWLWPSLIAFGKVTLVAGDPGLGKSILMNEIAAHASTGKRWPVDNTEAPCCDVLIASAEDDPADTIRPRLDAAGADVSRVLMLTSVTDDKGKRRPFSLAEDIDQLRETIKARPSIRVVIIDPISAYMAGTDSHNNADVRGLLMPLASMAQELGVAVIAVTHLNKSQGGNYVYRTMGSLAFVAAARAVCMVVRDPDDDERRLLLTVKNNLGPDNYGLAYRISIDESAPRIEWELEPVETRLADIFAQPHPEYTTKLNRAVDWLRAELTSGPQFVHDLRQRSRAASYGWRTIESAKEKLGVTAGREQKFEGRYFWTLRPSPLGPQDPSYSQFADLGNPDQTLGNKGFRAETAPRSARSAVGGGLRTMEEPRRREKL